MKREPGLFLGFARPNPGRENDAIGLYEELTRFLAQEVSGGKLASFEPVRLASVMAELDGFILVRGTASQLHALQDDPRFVGFLSKAYVTLRNHGVINAHLGTEIQEIHARLGKA